MAIPPLSVYGATINRIGHFDYSREAFRLVARSNYIIRIGHFG